MQSVTKCQIQFATIDQLNDAEQLRSLLQQNPKIKMIFLETLTNPLTFAPDIQLISNIAKSVSSEIWIVVDNTFATPYLCNPFDFGADIVLDSCTKFISGHSDSLMGALCCIDSSIYSKLQKIQILSGSVAPPLDCYLNLRGIKTLSLRVKQQCKSAMKIASYLASHPKVSKVYYPGLQDHPQYQIAQKQCKLPGSVMTVNIKGTFEQIDKFVFSLKHFIRGGSLGGVESLISHPATSSHSYMSKEERESVGIFDYSVRISIGIESFKDLKADLDQALDLI